MDLIYSLRQIQDEKKRIEDIGGCVVWFGAWRVNGSLAVSRSIGKSILLLTV